GGVEVKNDVGGRGDVQAGVADRPWGMRQELGLVAADVENAGGEDLGGLGGDEAGLGGAVGVGGGGGGEGGRGGGGGVGVGGGGGGGGGRGDRDGIGVGGGGWGVFGVRKTREETVEFAE